MPAFYLSHRREREREFVYSVEKPVIVAIKDKFRIYLEIRSVTLLVVLSFVAWIFTTVPARTTTKPMLQVTLTIVHCDSNLCYGGWVVNKLTIISTFIYNY